MVQTSLLKRIKISPSVMMGKPVICNTRITVEQILLKLSRGLEVEEILADYPNLVEEDIRAAMAYAAESLSREEILLLEPAVK